MSEPRTWLPWVGLAGLVLVAVVTAGWGNDASGPRRPPPATPSPALSAAAAVSLVDRADLVPGDLPSGYHAVPARGPSDLDAGDRLHFCGAAVPSERLRLAGHRQAFLASHGRRVRTEVAVYGPGGVEHALAQLQAAAPRCSRPVRPTAEEQPGTLALRVRLTGGAPGGVRRELLVERGGDVLTVLEIDGPPGPLTLDLARLLSGRLEAQPVR